MNATREKTRLWLLIFVGVVATLLGQTHAREIFAPSPHESGVFAAQTQASTGENYDGIQYDALDSLLAANSAPARVFWSGGSEARLAAEAFAKQSGGVTLEMTAAGQRLQGITKGMDWADAKPLWEAASADFARGASGSVNVFQNGSRGVSLESVWRGVEYPILKQQGNGIIYNVTKP